MNYTTLEAYLRSEMEQGKIDFVFRAMNTESGIQIYIHPNSKDGETTPNLTVAGNLVVDRN